MNPPNLALAYAVEGNRAAAAETLALRMPWSPIALPPPKKIQEMSPGWSVIWLHQDTGHYEVTTALGGQWYTTTVYGTTASTVRTVRTFNPCMGWRIQVSPDWTEAGFPLHCSLEDALYARNPDEHVCGIDWATKPINKTKRYLCISLTRLGALLAFQRLRPPCDNSLYPITLGGFAMRRLVLDVEASLLLNPHLCNPHAQDAYVTTLLKYLTIFSGQSTRHLVPNGSDSKKFSIHVYLEDAFPSHVNHDEFACRFIQWLRKQPGHKVLLIVAKFTDRSTGEAFKARTFAIDPFALGRNRQIRAPTKPKHGERTLQLPEKWKCEEDAIAFAFANDLNVPAPPRTLSPLYEVWVDRFVNDQGETTLHLLRNTQNRPPPEETFLYRCTPLYPFLKNYQVDTTAPNVMWKQQRTLNTTEPSSDAYVTRFAVPWEQYRAFLQVVAQCIDAHRPLLLHEVNDKSTARRRRPHLDLDGVRLDLRAIVREYALFLRDLGFAPTRVATKTSPPKEPGLERHHLIACDIVLVQGHSANKAHRIAFDQWMRQRYSQHDWPLNCVDAHPMNLRMLGADKADESSGQFAGRTAEWSGLWIDGEKVDVPSTLDRLVLCSIHLADDCTPVSEAEARLTLPVVPKNTIKDAGLPYDVNNDCHQIMAREIQRILDQHGLQKKGIIAGVHAAVDDLKDPHWIVTLKEPRFCVTLQQQIQAGTKLLAKRPSMWEHKSRHTRFKFRPSHVTVYCTDPDCGEQRRKEGFPRFPYQGQLFATAAEFSFDEPSPPPAASEQIHYSAPVSPVYTYLTHHLSPQDLRLHNTGTFLLFPNGRRIQHLERFHAYQQEDGRWLPIPHDVYTNPDVPTAMAFFACCANQNVTGFRCSDDLESMSIRLAQPLHCNACNTAGMAYLEIHHRLRAVPYCVTCKKTYPPGVPVPNSKLLHRAFHMARCHRLFPVATTRRFDSAEKLWDYDLSAPLAAHQTWFTVSGKGTGKTYQNIRVIGNKETPKPNIRAADGAICWDNANGDRPARVLIISPLIAVASFYAKVYDAANYDKFRMDLLGLLEQDRIIISLESLAKLPPHYCPDIVLLDECEWLLQIFSGTTMDKSRTASWATFRQVVSQAKLVVASDARLGTKSYGVLHAFRPSVAQCVFYNYHVENNHRYVRILKESQWFRLLKEAMDRKDGAIFLPTNKKEQAVQLRDFILRHDPGAKILLLTAETYHASKAIRYIVENCETEWLAFDYVIMTPVIGPALDFSPPHFRYCFAWATPHSATPAQFSQMIGRVRKILGKTVHLYVHEHGSRVPPSADLLRQTILRNARETARLGIQFDDRQVWNSVAQSYERGVYDGVFLDMHVANQAEECSGSRRFAHDFAQIVLQQQGSEIQLVETEDEEMEAYLKEYRPNRKQVKKDQEWKAFNEAPEITPQEAEQIRQDMERGINVAPAKGRSLAKRGFRSAYGLADDEEITREAFERDSKTRRKTIRTTEKVHKQPRLQEILRAPDLVELREAADPIGRVLADVQFAALPRAQQMTVLAVYGFPRSGDVAQTLRHFHTITQRFCERVGVLDQLRALGGQLVRKDDDPIKWLRRWLRSQFDARLQKKKDHYTIDTQKPMEIVQRRNPDLLVADAPTSDALSVRLPERYHAFVLAFSPRYLPALIAWPLGPLPSLTQGMAAELTELVTTAEGFLFSSPAGLDILVQDGQFWLIEQEQCTQWATCHAMMERAYQRMGDHPLHGMLYRVVAPLKPEQVKQWVPHFVQLARL